MDKIEVSEIIKDIIMFYPTFEIGTMEKTTNAWLGFFKDEDYETIKKNLKAHVRYENSPPTIADLLKANRFDDKIREVREKLIREEKEAQEFEDE